jgi:hypothetical protein
MLDSVTPLFQSGFSPDRALKCLSPESQKPLTNSIVKFGSDKYLPSLNNATLTAGKGQK